MTTTAPKRRRRKVKTFTIDRAKWLRGDSEHSYLLRAKDGLMCCLGQIACQLGAQPEHIIGRMRPEEVRMKLPWNPMALTINEMMDFNDEEDIDDETREHQLAHAARRLGWRLKFVGSGA